ncbi:MAG: ABC transporter ATP-binding protein [Methylococcaceae bacterium]|nr:ABC transporter ATP-binding protein [Methylococcaceae bacterium]
MTDLRALSIHDLGFSYGKKTALSGVSFEVQLGQCCILLGPNGAGKSTLFALITGLYHARDGRIALVNYDIQKSPYKALAQLGVVFQQSTLDLDLTVKQNLRYHAALHGISRRQADKTIQQELERFEMFERLHEKIRHLNGGHRRRVEIARALLHKPSVLLLDEPTVGLDVPSRQAIVSYIHALTQEQGLAVLWATHLIDEVYPTDQLVVLHNGIIQITGTVDEVIAKVNADNLQGAFALLTQKEAR